MKLKHRLSALFVVAFMILSLCSCKEEKSVSALSVYALSDSYASALAHGIAQTEDRAEVSVLPPQKILEILSNGDMCPDIIMLTQDTIAEAVKTGKLAPLSVDADAFYPYTTAPALKGGKLYAMPFHTSPGLFAYRRSIAKAYFGTDEPNRISELLSDWDSFLSAARLLKTASDGKTSIVAGTDDILLPYLSSDIILSNSDIVSGSDLTASYFEYCALLEKENLTAGARQWSEAWLKGMNDGRAVFGYFLSEVAINDVLSAECGESAGDWAVIAPFSPYCWGGAWLAVPAESRNKNDALRLISRLSQPAEAKAMCLYSGLFTPQPKINSSVSADPQFSLSLLSGQNIFEELERSADGIKQDIKTSLYDSSLLARIGDSAAAYAAEKCTLEEAVNNIF